MERRFHTEWLLQGATRQAAWDVLQDVAAWPQWWPGVESVVEVNPGDERRVGSVYRTRWRSAVGYHVEFDFRVEHVAEPTEMRGRATGMLAGTGVWRLFELDGGARVTYDWDVEAPRWMALLGPVASFSHDRLMRDGGRALAQRLGAA